MKKLLIIALFVLGMCNVSVFGMGQEIILTELYSIMPLDDPEDDGRGKRPDPTQFRAFINGTHYPLAHIQRCLRMWKSLIKKQAK